uniref:Uncharacterized protein n=1 Tax=Medicago truncatula TaxID=3880 RepID=I3S4A6_MEDTR|nr:unknown [Medicago truncatula]
MISCNGLRSNTTMFVLAVEKKLAQNMGTSYSAFGNTVKSKTCIVSVSMVILRRSLILSA